MGAMHDSILAIYAPGDAVYPGDVLGAGDEGRCCKCGQAIQWRAVVDTENGPRWYGLTCAGVSPGMARKRAHAYKLAHAPRFRAIVESLPHPIQWRADNGESLADYLDWAAIHKPGRAIKMIEARAWQIVKADHDAALAAWRQRLPEITAGLEATGLSARLIASAIECSMPRMAAIETVLDPAPPAESGG